MTRSELTTTSPQQPDFAFMRARLSRWVAFGFGSGLSRVAPGTVGTLLAWLVWVLVLGDWPFQAQLLSIVLGFALGVWACERAAADLRVHDHPGIVWDEIVAFWLVLSICPDNFGAQFAAFVLFRFFDIVKPPPIRQIDAGVRGGMGIMLDDLAAALAAMIVLWLWWQL